MKCNKLTQTTLALLAMTSAALGSSLAQAETKQSVTASTASPSAGPDHSDDKLDVSGLEKKYWSAKDTDFSVVQNRLFSKAGRFALSVEYGSLINDSWSDGPTLSGDLNYYFSERYGVQLEYSKTNSRDNDGTRQLITQGGVPNHNRAEGYYGIGFNWVPFYAKVSVLNSSIIYFDMAITPGIGVSQYDQVQEAGNVHKTAPTLSLDLSQHYFLNKWLAIRVDYKNHWYQQDVVNYRGAASSSSELNYESILGGGLNFYF